MALAELARARAPEFESVFLDDQPALEARYGTRVPVLRDERGDRERRERVERRGPGTEPARARDAEQRADGRERVRTVVPRVGLQGL